MLVHCNYFLMDWRYGQLNDHNYENIFLRNFEIYIETI